MWFKGFGRRCADLHGLASSEVGVSENRDPNIVP